MKKIKISDPKPKKKLRLTKEQSTSLSTEVLVKMIDAGYECPIGEIWDINLKRCVDDIG